MARTHVGSGGRYPVLRTVAILLLLCSFGVLIYGISRGVLVWRASSTDTLTRLVLALSEIGFYILWAIAIIGIAELIKLLIDIEHNTRMFGDRSGAVVVGGRTILEGEETAEGALIRGH